MKKMIILFIFILTLVSCNNDYKGKDISIIKISTIDYMTGAKKVIKQHNKYYKTL